MKEFDSGLVITFRDLDEVLDEMNTLIEVQEILRTATDGVVSRTWCQFAGWCVPPIAGSVYHLTFGCPSAVAPDSLRSFLYRGDDYGVGYREKSASNIAGRRWYTEPANRWDTRGAN